jgi:hypothetical protein
MRIALTEAVIVAEAEPLGRRVSRTTPNPRLQDVEKSNKIWEEQI